MGNAWYILPVVVFMSPAFLHAQVFLTEVMYDLEGTDTKREWIEVFNSGSTAVALTSYRLRENNVEHSLTTEGEKFLAPQSYAIIADNAAQFVHDHPGFSGPLFDSAFSLRNEGESIALVDAGGNAAEVSYSNAAANGTGESWQRSNAHDGLAPGKPTPGEGIPSGGLVRAVKSSPKKPTAREISLASAAAPSIVGAAPTASSSEIVLPRPESAWYEWLAPFLLAGVGASGIVVARIYQKHEWDIVEDFGETS